jgi:molecular chaperone HtpG
VSNIIALKKQEPTWSATTSPLLIGKDIMELLSSSMYIDPMSIYREYVQNAADAIDEFRNSTPAHKGRVIITIDTNNRNVRIRDNGIGVPQRHFLERVTAFGASTKRGTKARGFRGVGRLAGMGYCQQLTFRSRALGEQRVSELQWDCRKVKTMLRSNDFTGTLEELVQETVTHRTTSDTSSESFFEVELRDIIRHRDDALVSPDAVDRYLSQVAPVPFAPDFPFSEQIRPFIAQHVRLAELTIMINGAGPVYRPHRSTFEIRAGLTDHFTDLQLVTIDGDAGPTAIGWLLHHNYQGALPPRARIGGLRLRCGDIQVGDASIVENTFAEPRFNSWCVGELHIVDDRIVPNGRRDNFEQNAHHNNLTNQLGPIARALTQRARNGSLRRKYEREFGQYEVTVRQKIAIVRQGVLNGDEQERLINAAAKAVTLMEKIVAKNTFTPDMQHKAEKTLRDVKILLQEVRAEEQLDTFLKRATPKKRELYQRLFGYIYELAPTEAIAQAMIARMLPRLKRRS